MQSRLGGATATLIAAGVVAFWVPFLLGGCGSNGARPLEECALRADSVAFGAVAVGDSLDRAVVVTNTGRNPLDLVATLESADFGLAAGDSLPVFLPAEGTETLSVRFAPLSPGSKSAMLRFSGRTCPEVPVSGEAEADRSVVCSLQADSLVFPGIAVGDSAVLPASVLNLGGDELDLTAVLESADFRLAGGDSVPVHIAGHRTISLSVRFAPTSPGPKSAEIRFLGAACPGMPVSGEAAPPAPVFRREFPVSNAPFGVAVGRDGSIYVDFQNPYNVLGQGYHAAAAYAPDGAVRRAWGLIWSWPGGIAAGPAGSFFMVDAPYDAGSRGGTILSLSSATGDVARFGPSMYSPGRFGTADDVTVDEQGYIYVADGTAGRIQKFSPAGEPVESWWLDPPDRTVNRVPVAVQADRRGHVLECEFSSALNWLDKGSQVGMYTTGGEIRSVWTYSYQKGYGVPSHLAATANGDGFVYAIEGDDVAKLRPDGSGAGSWAVGHGLADISADSTGHLYCVDADSLYEITTGGARVAAWPYGGIAVTVEPSLGIFVLADDRVTRLTLNGEFVESWGESGTGDGRFQGASGIGSTLTGTLLIADRLNGRIQEMTPDGRFVGKFGNVPGEDGWPRGLTAVAMDAEGNLYETGAGDDLVQKLAPDGTFLRKWGGPGGGPGEFDSPRGIAVGGSGRIYVWDAGNRRVQVFDTQGRFLDAWEPVYEAGAVEARTPASGEPALAGIAASAEDVVYLVDCARNRVVAFSAGGNPLGSWGGAGSGAGRFDQPFDVAVGPDGEVVVADFGNRRVQVFGPPPR